MCHSHPYLRLLELSLTLFTEPDVLQTLQGEPEDKDLFRVLYKTPFRKNLMSFVKHYKSESQCLLTLVVNFFLRIYSNFESLK